MKRISLAFAALMMSACSPPAHESKTAEVPPATAPAAGCFAEASRDWSAVGSQYYIIEAEATGATCPEAVATIRITSRDGATLFEHQYPTASVSLAFRPHGSQSELRNELEEWTVNVAETGTADALPAWPVGAQRPPNFQPAPGVTRNQYEGARGAGGPLFCYPDGGESNACVALAGDRATLLGSRTPERI